MKRGQSALMVFSWAWVTVPFAYGVYELVLKLRQLFTG
ncbi:MFS transporter small subunit [Streptantibioticus ferralitis]